MILGIPCNSGFESEDFRKGPLRLVQVASQGAAASPAVGGDLIEISVDCHRSSVDGPRCRLDGVKGLQRENVAG